MAIFINGQQFGLGGVPEQRPPAAPGFSVLRNNNTLIMPDQWTDVDHVSYCCDALNQGQYNTCTAYAVSAGISATRMYRNNARCSPDPLDLFTKVSNNLYSGITLSAALNAAESLGVKATGDPPAVCKVLEAVDCPNVNEIATAVLCGYFVVTAIYIDPAIWQQQFNLRSTTPIVGPPDSVQDGHSILVVGLKNLGGNWHFKIQNSWGPTWGAAGFAYVPITYWQLTHFTDGWCIAETVC